MFGAELVYTQAATGLQTSGADRVLHLANTSQAITRTVVVATGVSYRRLPAPGVEELLGAGVFYGAAVTEAKAMAGQRVMVVGGANSAGQAAVHLARHASQVTLLHRGDALAESMSAYLLQSWSGPPTSPCGYTPRSPPSTEAGGWRRSPCATTPPAGPRRYRPRPCSS